MSGTTTISWSSVLLHAASDSKFCKSDADGLKMDNESLESESQRPLDETSRDSIGRSATANENDYRFHGLSVKFPHKPYRSQLMMMSRVSYTFVFLAEVVIKKGIFR